MKTKEELMHETNSDASARMPASAMCVIEISKLEVMIDVRDLLGEISQNLSAISRFMGSENFGR